MMIPQANDHKSLELAELQKEGKFKANREKDVLSTAIESKEHGVHIRGMSYKLSIKDGSRSSRLGTGAMIATRKRSAQ